MRRTRNNNSGITVIEAMVAIAAIAVLLGGFAAGLTLFLRTSGFAQEHVRAKFLAQEGIEAAIRFRNATVWDEDGIGSLAVGTPYHPALQGSPADWVPVPGPEIIGAYERTLEFDEVRRDAQDNIVEEGGTVDPDTALVRSGVRWESRGISGEFELETYLTNWR